MNFDHLYPGESLTISFTQSFSDKVTVLWQFITVLLVQTHTAVGRELEKLEVFHNYSLPPHQEIIHAYLKYEALCEHSYKFVCIECGIYPPVIITDVNKKCNFKMNGM